MLATGERVLAGARNNRAGLVTSYLMCAARVLQGAVRGSVVGRLMVVPKDFEIKRRIVDAICRNSGVSRPTFYRHFGSKFDLSSWYAKCVGEFYLDQIGRTYSWEKGLTEHFSLLYEKRDLFFFGAESSQDNYLSESMQLHRREVLIQTLRERGAELTPAMEFYVESYAFLETGMAGRWMRGCMDRDPGELGLYLAQCVPTPLYEALRLE